jgi:hypothetical protein
VAELILGALSNFGVRRRHHPAVPRWAPREERNKAMEYALLIYGDEKVWESRDEEERQRNMARHEKFAKLLQERNAMRGGKELAWPSSATTVRHRGDEASVTDGPFAETAEVLGGFYLIEAADLDAAIALAKELPESVVEIRPIVGM